MTRFEVEARHLPALAALKLYELAGPEGVALIVPRGRFKYYRNMLKEIGLNLPYACLMARSQADRRAEHSTRKWRAAGNTGRHWVPRNPRMEEAFAEARARLEAELGASNRDERPVKAANVAVSVGAMPPHPQHSRNTNGE